MNNKAHTGYWKTGLRGEYIVHKLLKGSAWMQITKFQVNHHDLEWKGIKIGVKTRTTLTRSSRTHFKKGIIFSIKTEADADILVLVGIFDELKPKFYFWVKKREEVKSSYYAKFKDSVKKRSLAEEIIKIANQ